MGEIKFFYIEESLFQNILNLIEARSGKNYLSLSECFKNTLSDSIDHNKINTIMKSIMDQAEKH